MGPNPIRTVIKLLVLSLVAGVVMRWLNVTPWSLVENFGDTVERLFAWGRRFVGWAVDYVLVGAVIVVPLWLILTFAGRVNRKP